MELIKTLLFVCPMLLVAGIIDGAVGGGGLIALPAYIMTGMPVHFAYGCNKMQSCIGTSASLFRYIKNGYVDRKVALTAAAPAILTSYVATRIILYLDDNIIWVMVIVLVPAVFVLMLFRRGKTGGDRLSAEMNSKNMVKCMGVGLLLGFYDGLFGPGGGTIAMMLFTIFFGYDMRVACGNGKLIIVVSNLIAFINYLLQGSILFEIAIPATIANVIGCSIGAELAVKKGNKIVMPFMLLVIGILLVQTGYQVISVLG